MPNIDVNADHINLKCKVRRSTQAINPEFDEGRDMTCTLKNWNGNSPTTITTIGFPAEGFFDQLSKSHHNNKRVNINGPELVLRPLTGKKRHSDTDSSVSSERAAALAQGVHQRFRSFGSIPLANYPSNVEIPLRKRHSRSSSNPLIYDNSTEENLLNESRSGPLTPKRSKSDSSAVPLHLHTNGTANEHSFLMDKLNIPISDIVVVDTDGSYSGTRGCQCIPAPEAEVHEIHQMFIATYTLGYFEFTFYSRNAQDVMLAFLQATLPNERITRIGRKRSTEFVNSNSNTQENSSYDMDYFTSKEMHDMFPTETLSEKMLSKIQTFFSSFDTLTHQFTECVCGDTRPMSPPTYADDEIELFEATTPTKAYDATSRSDAPVRLFSYEDNEVNLRDSAPTIEIGADASFSMLSHAGSSSSNKSSFSREAGKLRRKKIPNPVY